MRPRSLLWFLCAVAVNSNAADAGVGAGAYVEARTGDGNSTARFATPFGSRRPALTKCARRVIGYVTSWSQRAFTGRQAKRLTNVVFSFVIMRADGSLTVPSDPVAKRRYDDVMAARKAMRSAGASFDVSFAVGGWTNSEHFSAAVANAGARAKLVSSVAAVVATHGFDGVDIDWEFPKPGADRQNLVELVRELRSRLGHGKLVSVAAPSSEYTMRGLDARGLAPHVDWIGVMTYDYYGSWSAVVGPNAPLHFGAPPNYVRTLNDEWTLNKYVADSSRPDKIVMGLPFYGRYWSKTVPGPDPGKYPLFRTGQLVNGNYGGAVAYGVLVRDWLKPSRGFVAKWDDRTQTPWAICSSTGELVTYDNQKSIAAKVNFVHAHRLAGVMIWSVDQDDEELSLISAAATICAPRYAPNTEHRSVERGPWSG